MSRSKVKNSEHSYQRSKERTPLYKRQAKKLMKEASRCGKAAGNLPEGPLKKYVESKGKQKRVKCYQGYIFVFAKTSTSCITFYPVKEEILEAQKQYDSVQTKV